MMNILIVEPSVSLKYYPAGSPNIIGISQPKPNLNPKTQWQLLKNGWIDVA